MVEVLTGWRQRSILGRYRRPALLKQHNELFVALRELIDTCGAVAFQNGRGLSTETFLELLNMYLSSTVVKYGDFLFVQKKGISIASCLAPVLCHAFLAKFDGMLQEASDDTRVIRF